MEGITPLVTKHCSLLSTWNHLTNISHERIVVISEENVNNHHYI